MMPRMFCEMKIKEQKLSNRLLYRGNFTIMEVYMWKEKFFELLFPVDYTKVLEEEAFQLKFNNIPSSLYKYGWFDPKDYWLENLKNDVVWLSKPENFNDPFDCSLTVFMNSLGLEYMKRTVSELFDDELSTQELELLNKSEDMLNDVIRLMIAKNSDASKQPDYWHKYAYNLFQFGFQTISDLFEIMIKDKVYVSCFSETFESILMWSHYANKHTGYCIEYDFTQLDYKSEVSRMLYPIKYCNKLFNATDYMLPEFMNGITNEFFVICATISKSLEWKYENEWRLVLFDPFEQTIEVPTPKTIYLGTNISSENKERMCELADSKKIPIYHMKRKESEFKLISVKR